MKLLLNRPASRPARRSTLQLEALEKRDALSASPLPVLMVLPNQDYYHSQNRVTAAPAAQNDSFYGRGIYKSTDSGKTWTIQAPSFETGSNSITSGIDIALSDYGQWRTRFGTTI